MPEGTRVEGAMQIKESRWGAAEHWHGEDGSSDDRWVLTGAIQGTENQMPKGSGAKGVLKFLFRGGRKIPARFIFGEPVRVAYMDKAAECYANGEEDKLKQLRVQLVMLLVARSQLANDGEKYVGEENIKLMRELENHPFSQSLNKLSNLGEVVVKPEELVEEPVEEKKGFARPRLRFEPGPI